MISLCIYLPVFLILSNFYAFSSSLWWTNGTEPLNHMLMCIGWREVTSGQISNTGTICNSVVNPCNSFASEGSGGFWRAAGSGGVNADVALSGILSSPATERPGTYRQSLQIILLWGGAQLTALAFCFGHTIFFLRHAWSSLCGVERSPWATLLAFNGHPKLYLRQYLYSDLCPLLSKEIYIGLDFNMVLLSQYQNP